MHGTYLESKNKWNRNSIISYFNKLAAARMIFIINFEKNKDYHMGKSQKDVDNPQSVEETPMEVN